MSRARKLFNVGYALVLAVVVASGVVTYINLGTIDASNRGVEHTREVLIELRRLQSTYKNAETNQRAYLQTGEDAYLKPFRAASAELDGSVDRLASLSTDDPAQRGRIAELVRLKSSIMENLHRAVALREEGDLQAAEEAVRTDSGKRDVDRAGQLVAEMVGEEERLLKGRTERSGIAHRRTVASFTVATGTAVLLLAAIFYLKRHEDIEQERAAEAVRKSEAWLATTLESIGDAVIATDGRGRVRFINPVGRTLSRMGSRGGDAASPGGGLPDPRRGDSPARRESGRPGAPRGGRREPGETHDPGRQGRDRDAHRRQCRPDPG